MIRLQPTVRLAVKIKKSQGLKMEKNWLHLKIYILTYGKLNGALSWITIEAHEVIEYNRFIEYREYD